MPYDAMKELRAQWARWVEEENKCPHCGGILPWMQSPFANSQSAQHSVQRTAGTCRHLSTEFDYICMRCGKLVPASNQKVDKT